MEPSCVRQDQIPGTSGLFTDYLYRFQRLSALFPFANWDAAELPANASTIQFPAERRAALVAALREQNTNVAALKRLAEPNTVAVVTGQQVGFLLGPAYTIFKALTAVKLAASLNEKGVSAVPIFWLATEDHDLAEVDHAWLFNHEAKPAKISTGEVVTTGGPVGDVVLTGVKVDEIRAALGDLPFADEVTAKVAAFYQPGATLGASFRGLLEELLKDMGLLFLDPLAPSIRRLGAPLLRDAVQRVPELTAALRARDKQIAEAGYHSQVHLEDDSSLFFLLKGGRRLPIRWKDGRFSTKDASYSAAELAEMADQLSPNALLRPVMQDYMLPTVSYVGGPAEIAYFAQGAALYEKLLGRMPVIYPRKGFTLIDARAAKLLDRYHLRLPDLLDHEEKVKGRIAGQLVPATVASGMQQAQAAAAQAVQKMVGELRAFDPTLAAAAQKSGSKITFQFEKLARKTASETLRRDERSARDAAYLQHLIYPRRHLQERFYSILPFLAKHGLDLPGQLLADIQLSCADHMVRTF